MSHNPGRKRAASARPAVCVSDDDYKRAFADWVSSLGPAEARQAVFIAGNRKYTPAEMLQEMDQRSSVGKFFSRSLRKLRILKAS
jgi:hypothetical protein